MKILYKFTLRNLLKNKKRTIVTIVGTVLAVTLLFVVGLVSSSIRDNEIRNTIEYSGDHHVMIDNQDMNDDVKKAIDNNSKIDHYLTIETVDTIVDEENEAEYKILSASFDYSDNFVLTEGKLPTNNNEIIINFDFAKWSDVKIGDTYSNDEIIYKVVGIYNESKFDHYVHNSDYIIHTDTFYTKSEGKYPEKYYIYFKDMKDTYSESYKIAEEVGFARLKYPLNRSDNRYENIYLNAKYLSWFGIGNKEYMRMIKTWIVVIISVLAIFSSLAIYNAFAISVSERKKTFGIFRSLGATKKNVFLSVLFEAFLIAIIAIPLGIILSVLLAFIVSNIISSNFPDTDFKVVMYPSFIYISLLFSVIMIFLSAIIPAFKSSRVSPLDAIRLNNETKLKKNKVKKKKGLLSFFGPEAVLARNNITRNRKKYRSAKLSLIISIVLFMVIGNIINLILGEIEEYKPVEYPITLSVEDTGKGANIVKEITSIDEVDKYLVRRSSFGRIPIETGYFTDEYLNKGSSDYEKMIASITIQSYDRSNYNALKKKYGVSEDVIFVNKNYFRYSESAYVDDEVIPMWKDGIDSINVYDVKEEENENFTSLKDQYKYTYDINNPYYTFDNLYFVDDKDFEGYIIMSNEEYDKYLEVAKDHLPYIPSYDIGLNSKKYKVLDERIKDLENTYTEISNYYNELVEYEDYYKMIYGLEAGVYAFFAFIILIAATNVINTINTSMDLRKRDFAILRSVGLSKNSFNKMLFYEGLVLGFDALIFGHLISGILIFLTMMSNIFGDEMVPYPFTYLIISIIGIYVIIFLAIYFASRKAKKANIIETIRNDNV